MKRHLGVFVLATMLLIPVTAFTADPLPAGFIALSKKEMTWDEAKTFCEQQGGRLPLIDGKKSRRKVYSHLKPPIDGFGTGWAPWPAGLPSESYWSGSEAIGPRPVESWAIGHDKWSHIIAYQRRQTAPLRVLCVPPANE